MNFPFDPSEGLIMVPTRLWGPSGSTLARLALDTGANWTLLNWHLILLLGYDPAAEPERKQITTASGVEFVPRLTVAKIEALYQERQNFPYSATLFLPARTSTGYWAWTSSVTSDSLWIFELVF